MGRAIDGLALAESVDVFARGFENKSSAQGRTRSHKVDRILHLDGDKTFLKD